MISYYRCVSIVKTQTKTKGIVSDLNEVMVGAISAHGISCSI